MAEERLVQKNIRFPQALWDRVEDVVGDQQTTSQFVRDAVEAAVRLREGEMALRLVREMQERRDG